MTKTGFDLDGAARALIGDTPPRVWSLIVTFFGDLAQEPGQSVPGPVLSRVMERADVRPEAMRVALHRLKRDGWIDGEKRGRTVAYHLTERGRQETVAATPRIYGAAPGRGTEWVLIAVPPGDVTDIAFRDLEGYVRLSPGLVVGPKPDDDWVTSDMLVLDFGAQTPPGWIRNAICPEDLVSEAETLAADISRVVDWIGGARLDPLERAVLRVLTVHRWRKLALRLPDAPADLMPERWVATDIRARVTGLLEMLPRPAPEEIDGADTV